MEKKDLMIGDWVTFKDCQHENPMPIKIIAIGFQADEEDDCLVQINGDKACDIITIDDEIVGIPLTAEILEKNFQGYRRGSGALTHFIYELNEDFFIHASAGSIDLCIHYDDSEHAAHDDIYLVELRYAHELQHALRLFGIEKEIEL